MTENGGARARAYAKSTVRRLDTLSGNQCANPDCSRQLVSRDGESITSKICHIEAASEGGPRWRDMPDDERRHFSNLILLCDECHTMIDNPNNQAKYPVERLKKWKQDHESQRTYVVLSQNPTLLGVVVDALAELDLETERDESGEVRSFKIEEKIEYNDLKRNRAIIDEHKVLYPQLNALYNALQAEGSFKKRSLLRNVRQTYVKVKGRYVQDQTNEMKIIRANADSIFEDVQDELLSLAGRGKGRVHEDLAFGVSVVLVDAFMKCKILEAPPS